MGVTLCQWATAMLNNGLARYDAALAAAEQAAEDPRELWFSPGRWSSRSRPPPGAARPTAASVAAGVDRVDRCERDSVGLGFQARCRALLSDDDAAEPLYLEALDRLRPTPLRVDSREPSWSTASGCGARGGDWMPVNSYEPLTSCSPTWGWRRSPSVPASSWRRPASERAGARRTPPTSSPRRRLRSRASRPRGAPTARLPPSSSSARGRSVSPSQGVSQARRQVTHPARAPPAIAGQRLVRQRSVEVDRGVRAVAERLVRRAAAAAHRHGIRVIDHVPVGAVRVTGRRRCTGRSRWG